MTVGLAVMLQAWLVEASRRSQTISNVHYPQASRYPESTYPSVKLLIGKDGSHQHANLYETLHRTKLHSNTTSNKIQYKNPALVGEASSNTILNHPEEYLAMQLSHAKKLAKAAAGELVVDTVVTVSFDFKPYLSLCLRFEPCLIGAGLFQSC